MSSSSYEKVIKLACKPKAAPPKTKYMDPIIAATWSEDGAVHDVCKALSPRFKEPNAIVVFKALIVLHTMIRNGSTDNVLGYLSNSDVLRLRNISSTHWEGYAAPQNLQSYAVYLDSRIRAFRDLKHDAIRVQSESNRDLRNSIAIEEGRVDAGEKLHKSSRRRFGGKKEVAVEEPPSASGHQRSKTMAGRKLRVMTVEKGLLRETKIVQKMIDALVECRFYLDDLEDELNITALRMLVKDLLILFQACNEGVINVLEHYFEMSHVDAKEALGIYRLFCQETEKVVEFLSVAKKLQNLLNVPIPNLRHAPVSLAGSLEEYLNDPNFEQNRIEYKTQKNAADKAEKEGHKQPAAAAAAKPSEKSASPDRTTTASTSAPVASSSTSPPKPGNQALVDFFSAIEEEQPQMFNPQTNSPTANYFQQQAVFNPFSQQPMMTGMPMMQQPQIQVQPTAIFQPQQGTNPFGLQPQPQPQPFVATMVPAQPNVFLQPQQTGAANPFRMSMAMPQMTGMPSFGGMATGLQGQPTGAPTNPFPIPPVPLLPTTNPFPTQPPQPAQNTVGQNLFSAPPPNNNPFPAFAQPAQPQVNLFGPAPAASSPLSGPPIQSPPAASNANAPTTISPPRPASAPLRPNAETLQPVKSHQTGSRNPFGVPVAPVPPVPKIPTLMELAMGINNSSNPSSPGAPMQQLTQLGAAPSPFNSSGAGTSSGISGIASSFVFDSNKGPTRSSTMPITGLDTGTTASTTTGSAFSSSLFSSVSPQTTATSGGPSSPAMAPSISITSAGSQPLQPQMTGFGGIKPFKPTTSFGTALLDSLPSAPQEAKNSPSTSPLPTTTTGFGSGLGSNFGSGLGAGFGTGNKNLTSSLGTGTTTTTTFGAGTATTAGALPSFSSGLTTGVGLRPQATGMGAANPFRASMFPATGGPTNPLGAPGPVSNFGSAGLGGSNFTNSASLPALGTTQTGFVGTNGLTSLGTGAGVGTGIGAGTGTSMFAGWGGATSFGTGQDASKQPQQQPNGQFSLI